MFNHKGMRMNYPAAELRGIKKQRCHSGSPLAGIQGFP
jgi:hypothetical protein